MKRLIYTPTKNPTHTEFVRTEGDVLETIHICSMVQHSQTEQDRIKYGKLFASAPELLAALEQMIFQMEVWPGDKNPESFVCMKNAREAIENAKG